MSVKYGCTSLLSPASEHPLQDIDSPSPIRPLHTGSTSALYTPSIPVIFYQYVINVYVYFHYNCQIWKKSINEIANKMSLVKYIIKLSWPNMLYIK